MQNSITVATAKLKNNQVIAFPTEGVFGLGSNVNSQIGCNQIFTIKDRNKNKPLLLHVKDVEQAQQYGIFSNKAKLLAQTFWPGGLTIITHINPRSNIKKNNINLNTIGIRIPNHEVTIKMIENLGAPIAGSSANFANHLPATKHQHLTSNFNSSVYIVKSPVKTGIESTIIDVTNEKKITILRPGPVCQEDILKKTHIQTLVKYDGNPLCENIHKFYIHKNTFYKHQQNKISTTIHVGFAKHTKKADHVFNLSKSGCLEECGKNFYDIFFQIKQILKQNNIDDAMLQISPIPLKKLGIAINHRIVNLTNKML